MDDLIIKENLIGYTVFSPSETVLAMTNDCVSLEYFIINSQNNFP